MSRSEITQAIIKYIRDNNLQDSKNKRNINPDEKLKMLFKLKPGDEVTYFNCQRYLTQHCNQ